MAKFDFHFLIIYFYIFWVNVKLASTMVLLHVPAYDIAESTTAASFFFIVLIHLLIPMMAVPSMPYVFIASGVFHAEATNLI